MTCVSLLLSSAHLPEIAVLVYYTVIWNGTVISCLEGDLYRFANLLREGKSILNFICLFSWSSHASLNCLSNWTTEFESADLYGCLTSACFLELLEKQVATKLLIDVSIWTQNLPFIYPRVFSLVALNDTTVAIQVILDVIVEAILMEISSRLTVN